MRGMTRDEILRIIEGRCLESWEHLHESVIRFGYDSKETDKLLYQWSILDNLATELGIDYNN